MPRISSTRCRESASGDTRVLDWLPGTEMLAIAKPPWDPASLSWTGVVTAKCLTHRPLARAAHSGATVLDFHQLPSRRHAIRTLGKSQDRVKMSTRANLAP